MIFLDLQLFAGDGAGDGAGVDSQVAVDIGTEDVQATQEVVTEPELTPEQRAEAYKKFKSDYKPEYDAEVQGIVKGRVSKLQAEIKDHKAYRDKTAKIFDALSVKYGIEPDKVDEILEAVTADDSYYADAAYEKGLDVEEFKHIKAIESENRRLKSQDEAREAEQRQREFVERVEREAQITRSLYPGFDLNAESENPAFRDLVVKGVDIRTAYEVVHRDEIIELKQKEAATMVSSKMQASQKAKAKRPSESAAGHQNAYSTAVDISKLTKEQMQAYKERARRGEKVTFK